MTNTPKPETAESLAHAASGTGPASAKRAVIVEREDASRDATSAIRVFGLTPAARLHRTLAREDIDLVDTAAGSAPPIAGAGDGTTLVLRDDHFYDERVVRGLAQRPGVVVRCPTGPGGVSEPVAACASGDDVATAIALLADCEPGRATPPQLETVSPLDLAPAYDPALRKHDPPFIYRANTQNVREVEDRLFAASYKGATDAVTKWVLPLPARFAVRRLAALGVRPNSVTALSYVLVVLATLCFAQGWFAVGLVSGWLTSFLDTVDGKLARVTLTSSRLGNVLDHGLDLVHPPIWWAAWAYGLAPGAQGYELAMWIVVGGYVLGRILEGIFLWRFGIEFFVWRPFDRVFRLVVARRNPNLLLLTVGVVCGRPDLGFWAVAVWTLVCLVIAAERNVRGLRLARRGVSIRSWLDEGAEAARSAS